MVFSAVGARNSEATASAQDFLSAAGEKTVIVKHWRDGYFPYIGSEIKDFFEELKQLPSPDLVLTHYRDDRHQDHRIISDLTWNTFRDHLILEYEIPKYDGDLGTPNFFVTLNETTGQAKIDKLMRHFATQSNKQWFTPATFWALLRLRGIESNAPDQYAEAFYCRKFVL